jgi:hypothetical protein
VSRQIEQGLRVELFLVRSLGRLCCTAHRAVQYRLERFWARSGGGFVLGRSPAVNRPDLSSGVVRATYQRLAAFPEGGADARQLAELAIWTLGT